MTPLALEEYSSVLYCTVQQCSELYYTKLYNVGPSACGTISFWYGNADGGQDISAHLYSVIK